MFEKKKFTENRNLAWSVFTVIVILSVIMSGGGALKEMRGDVLEVYYYGANNDGLCIAGDMAARLESAYNLASTAKRYEAIPSSASQAVADACDSVKAVEENDIAEIARQNASLTRSVEELYTEIDNAQLTEIDKTYALSQYKEFNSRALTISRDVYNARAEEFNAMIDGFPTSVVARVSQVDELGLFR